MQALVAVWLAGSAQAGGERMSLSFGLAGLGARDSGGALGAGYWSLRVAGPVYFDLGGREGLLLGPTRVATGIHAGARVRLGERWFVRGGLAHQHEATVDELLAEPVGVLVGAGDGVGHRSGGELGIGLQWTLPAVSTSGVHTSVSASALGLPDDDGPRLYGVIETLVTIDLGRPRQGV